MSKVSKCQLTDPTHDIPIPGWPTGKYGAILADPPWFYKTYSEKGRDRSTDKHYASMSVQEICDLPVRDLALPDCILFLWITDPHLLKGLDVMASWGFEYKTMAFVWAKQCRVNHNKWHMGNGYYTRANPEYCMLGTRGKPKRLNADVRELIVSPVREHSRKPDEVYDRVERLIAGPYCELFGRTVCPGWDTWGKQAGTFIQTLSEPAEPIERIDTSTAIPGTKRSQVLIIGCVLDSISCSTTSTSSTSLTSKAYLLNPSTTPVYQIFIALSRGEIKIVVVTTIFRSIDPVSLIIAKKR